jgi:hypothetical protein
LDKEYVNAGFKMFDILGNEIKSVHFSGQQLIINRENIRSGIYFCHIYSYDKLIGYNKLIIE